MLMRWYPGPDCPNAVRASQPECKPVTCICGLTFCFLCSNEWHEPISCRLLKKWLEKCSDDFETSNWISANTKERSVPSATLPLVSRANLEWCLFYYNRYANHLQSMGFEHKLQPSQGISLMAAACRKAFGELRMKRPKDSENSCGSVDLSLALQRSLQSPRDWYAADSVLLAFGQQLVGYEEIASHLRAFPLLSQQITSVKCYSDVALTTAQFFAGSKSGFSGWRFTIWKTVTPKISILNDVLNERVSKKMRVK